MKRTLFTALLAVAAVTAFAKADDEQLKLTKSDGVATIFDSSKKANIKFVYAEDCTASYQGVSAMPYKEYVKVNADWEEEHTYGEGGFTEDWNKRNKKGMKIVDGDADIQIVVTIHGIKEMSAFNVWWEITNGEVQFLNAEGQSIVEFKIDEYYEGCSGFKAMKLRNRIKETMEGLSESIIYFAKKANK